MENNPPITSQTSPSQPVGPEIVTPQKSFFSGKLLLLIVAVLILILAAGGTYLALNSKPKPAPIVLKIIPTSVPTPTPDPTASWKTVSGDGFLIKYPPEWMKKNCDTGTIILNETEFFQKYDECHSDPSSTLSIFSKDSFSPYPGANEEKVQIKDFDAFKFKTTYVENYSLIYYVIRKPNGKVIVFKYLKKEKDMSQLIERIIETLGFS